MYTNDFEDAFSLFLESREYDELSDHLYSLMRLAFVAGWKAAGGEPKKTHRLFEVLPGGNIEENQPREE